MFSPLRNRTGKRLREPFGKAGLTVAVIALVFAMLGGAWAAAGLNPKQKKEVKSIAKSFQGTGPAGPQGAAGLAGPAGAKGDTGPKGDKGDKGDKGEKGEKGPKGDKGEKGEKGEKGDPAEFPEFLPSGRTETGVWGLAIEEQVESFEKVVPITFPIPLEDPGKAYYLSLKEIENEEGEGFEEGECTGTAVNPTAPPGVLCMYTAEESDNFETLGFAIFGELFGEYTSSGTMFRFNPKTSSAPARFQRNGTWAVTAP